MRIVTRHSSSVLGFMDYPAPKENPPQRGFQQTVTSSARLFWLQPSRASAFGASFFASLLGLLCLGGASLLLARHFFAQRFFFFFLASSFSLLLGFFLALFFGLFLVSFFFACRLAGSSLSSAICLSSALLSWRLPWGLPWRQPGGCCREHRGLNVKLSGFFLAGVGGFRGASRGASGPKALLLLACVSFRASFARAGVPIDLGRA